MKKLLLLAATSVFFTRMACADTSYLLVQGPFGSGSSTETFQWQVNYVPGSLPTGLSLMNAVFGTAADTHTTYQGYEVYSASNTINGNPVGVSYIDFGSGGSSLFITSFTLGGTTVQQDPSFDPGWNYYVAGGTGANALGLGQSGPYPSNGSWTYSNDGLNSRGVSNGSFDGWVFGENFPAIPISGFSPTVSNFSGATVVNFGAVPEPGCTALLAAGGLLLFRRRR